MSKLRLRATPVGDALLVHPRGHLDPRAAGFARGLSRDPQHTLVVVDLPAGVLADEWRSVAKLLSSTRYSSLRIVFGRDKGEPVRRAATLISERLDREVLATDGTLVPTATGGLFVRSDDSAWIRFRPGRPSQFDSQRFPKPHWESSLPSHARAISASTTAQPVPSGVWLRHTERDLLPDDHQRTVETVPTDPHRLLVVLGSPGTPPLPIDDVSRYWEGVLPDARDTVRFHLYGTLDIPDLVAPGQYLADALDHEVVLCSSLPYNTPSQGEATSALAYVPARNSAHVEGTQRPDGIAAPNPTPAQAATAGPSSEPETSGTTPDAAVARGVGEDSELGTRNNSAGVAGGSEIAAGDPLLRSAHPTAPAATRSLPQTPRVQVVSASTAPTPGTVREAAQPSMPDKAAEPAPVAPGAIPEPAAAMARLQAAPQPAAPETPQNSLLEPGTPREPDHGVAPPTPPHSVNTAPAPTLEPDPASQLPSEPPEISAPETGLAPEPEPPARPVRAAAPRFRLESGTPAPEPARLPDPQPATGPTPAPTQPTPVLAPPSASNESPGVLVQPVPKSPACAVPPERGIARERDWLRRTFSEQYNATAGAVSRVMSETPGLRGGSKVEAADALTELVAVRLYLSGDSRGADATVRTATTGPHVPFARCVTAGLRRLPSYRGPALLRTRLTDAERAWYSAGRLVTEWAFCHARTSLHTGPRGLGATDVLIWSMTSRRTTSLDPTLPDRVVFLPGSVFKVLRTDGNTVLLREVSPSEVAEDGKVDVRQARLDEIALKGLENILGPLEKAGTTPEAQSADPPGLILTPGTGHAGQTEGITP